MDADAPRGLLRCFDPMNDPRRHNIHHRLGDNATQREMVRQIEYLKTENEILRSKLPKRITVTPVECARWVKVGRKGGAAIRRAPENQTAEQFVPVFVPVDHPNDRFQPVTTGSVRYGLSCIYRRP